MAQSAPPPNTKSILSQYDEGLTMLSCAIGLLHYDCNPGKNVGKFARKEIS